MIRSAIDKLKADLKLNREVDVSIQFGYKYSDIH